MNKIDDVIESKKHERLNSLQFFYMDGCPSDFEFKSPSHTVTLVRSVERSNVLLRSAAKDSVYKFGSMREWKCKKGDVQKYRKSVKNALKLGRLNCGVEINAMRFSMDFLIANGEALQEKHIDKDKFVKNAIEYVATDGKKKYRLINCPDHKGNAITISEDRMLLLFLWSEFIIMNHERLEVEAKRYGFNYDGLVICSDFICGDDVGNTCKLSNVVRAMLNDAYPDKITFRNSGPKFEIVGDYFADNMASHLHKFSISELRDLPLNEGLVSLNVFEPQPDFFFKKIR